MNTSVQSHNYTQLNSPMFKIKKLDKFVISSVLNSLHPDLEDWSKQIWGLDALA